MHSFICSNVSDSVRINLYYQIDERKFIKFNSEPGHIENRKIKKILTCTTASSPNAEHDNVGVVPKNPESDTSSTVSPIDNTSVAFKKDTIM